MFGAPDMIELTKPYFEATLDLFGGCYITLDTCFQQCHQPPGNKTHRGLEANNSLKPGPPGNITETYNSFKPGRSGIPAWSWCGCPCQAVGPEAKTQNFPVNSWTKSTLTKQTESRMSIAMFMINSAWFLALAVRCIKLKLYMLRLCEELALYFSGAPATPTKQSLTVSTL